MRSRWRALVDMADRRGVSREQQDMRMTQPGMKEPPVKAGRKNLRDIMKQLDAWVSRHGNGKYVAPNFVPPLDDFRLADDAGIQQDREEIKAFISLLLKRERLPSVLEVGLGNYGSTHFLWRLLFDRVITIEKSHERVRTFGSNLRAFYRQWVLDDPRSSFLIGSSHDPDTVGKAYQCTPGGVDLLFLDGDHRYTSVLTDWLLYSPLVRPGGLVAFHDVAATIDGYYGVPQFVERLAQGHIDGQAHRMTTIIKTKSMGLAFYEK